MHMSYCGSLCSTPSFHATTRSRHPKQPHCHPHKRDMWGPQHLEGGGGGCTWCPHCAPSRPNPVSMAAGPNPRFTGCALPSASSALRQCPGPLRSGKLMTPRRSWQWNEGAGCCTGFGCKELIRRSAWVPSGAADARLTHAG